MQKGNAKIYERLGFIGIRYCDIVPNQSDTDKVCWSASVSQTMFGERSFDLRMRRGSAFGSCTIESFSQDKANRLVKNVVEISKKGQVLKPQVPPKDVAKLDEPIRDLVVFDRELGKYYAYNEKHLFLIEDRRYWKRNLVPAPSERDSLFVLGGTLHFLSLGRLYKCDNLDNLFCESDAFVMPRWRPEIEDEIDLYSLYKEDRQTGLVTWNGTTSRLAIYREDLSLADERGIVLPKGAVATGLFVLGLTDWRRLTALFMLSDGSLLKVDDTCDVLESEEEMHYGAGARNLRPENVGGSLDLPARDLSFAGIGRFIALGHESFGLFKDGFLYLVVNRSRLPTDAPTGSDATGDT